METKIAANTARIAALEKLMNAARWRSWAILGFSVAGFALNVIRMSHDGRAAGAQPITISPTIAPDISPTQTTGATGTPEPDRDWITVEEFGARNGIASRTVLSYIEAGRILPEPEKSGRAWRLAADSRIQP